MYSIYTILWGNSSSILYWLWENKNRLSKIHFTVFADGIGIKRIIKHYFHVIIFLLQAKHVIWKAIHDDANLKDQRKTRTDT